VCSLPRSIAGLESAGHPILFSSGRSRLQVNARANSDRCFYVVVRIHRLYERGSSLPILRRRRGARHRLHPLVQLSLSQALPKCLLPLPMFLQPPRVITQYTLIHRLRKWEKR
jgi:hypothetical protein